MQDIDELRSKILRAEEEIKKEIVGQREVVRSVLVGILSGGNVLLEGLPGLGKTRLVNTISHVCSLPFKRIQFTPDLMPSDITGTNMIDSTEQGMSFRFEEGPIFASLVLADEINRATPKTQAALLEAMQEHTVTVGKVSHKLPEPFFVLATENPIESEGTYPLPEAQLDRFFMKILVPQPTKEEMRSILVMNEEKNAKKADAIVNGEDLLLGKELIREMPVSDAVMDFLLDIIDGTRTNPYTIYGSSPRGAEGLLRGAKALAFLEGRYNVSFEDVKKLAFPVLRHRIGLSFDAVSEGITEDDVIRMIIDSVEKAGKQ